MFSFWTAKTISDPTKSIPDLSDRVFLITGGSDGLGYETALQLAHHSPKHIYLACRGTEKTAITIARIVESVKSSTGTDVSAKLTHLLLDLSSFRSVRQAVQAFLRTGHTLNVLINNAGIMCVPPGTTSEGYEVHFGVNHMGHALLTQLLLPSLAQAAALGQDARVITLASSSEAQAPHGGLLLDVVKSPMLDFSGWDRYGQSKLANVLYTRALAEKHKDICFVCLHPGVVKTDLSTAFLNSWSWQVPIVWLIMWSQWVTPYEGAWLQEWLATTDRKDLSSGSFYYPGPRTTRGSRYAQSEELAAELYRWTQEELDTFEST
jgi:NAD(P)-dependent dehydrogenase (short-subunit alcohol dehydrogenase family)